MHVALSRSQRRSPASSLARPHRHAFAFLSRTFPPPINCSDIRKRRGEVCVRHLQACSCQALTLNAGQVTKLLITSCSSSHTTKCSGLTSELLSAAPALARGSNYSYIPLRTRDWFQSVPSSSTALRSLGRGLSIPPVMALLGQEKTTGFSLASDCNLL